MADTPWWGVDSLGRADRPDADGRNDLFWKTDPRWKDRDKPTLWEYVVATTGRSPEFWGRYISGVAAEFLLTPDEVNFFSQQGCSILCICSLPAQSTKGDRATGQQAAQKAIAAATKLKVPQGTWIYADIEPGWTMTANWLLGWWDKMAASSFGGVGGLYANTAPINHANINDPYGEAVKKWESENGSWLSILTDKVSNLYAQTPAKGCGANVDDLGFTLVQPDAPPGRRDDVVLWQYAINCRKVGQFWSFDMDVANDRGFNSLWQP
jgi:hypothetical protein